MLVSTEHTGEPSNPQHWTLGTLLPTRARVLFSNINTTLASHLPPPTLQYNSTEDWSLTVTFWQTFPQLVLPLGIRQLRLQHGESWVERVWSQTSQSWGYRGRQTLRINIQLIYCFTFALGEIKIIMSKSFNVWLDRSRSEILSIISVQSLDSINVFTKKKYWAFVS